MRKGEWGKKGHGAWGMGHRAQGIGLKPGVRFQASGGAYMKLHWQSFFFDQPDSFGGQRQD